MTNPLEVTRRIYRDFGRGDVPAVLSALSPDVHWIEAAGSPYGGAYHGPQAVLENVFAKLGADWEGWSAVPEGFVAEGDTVVALGTYRAINKTTQKSIAVPFAHVWTVEGGKVVRFHQHTDTAIVREASSR